MDPHKLSDSERLRYARHLSIPNVGEDGQLKLKQASVLLIGTGGLGSPAALYLAAAGVGRIGLVDDDRVERSNLQRQILHGDSDVDRSKLDSARERLGEINPEIRIDCHPTRFDVGNAEELVADYDLVLDGSDNFPTRFLSNDVCFLTRKPLVYGSIFRFEGQVTVFAPHKSGPCYRCMLPSLPAPGAAPSCAEAGVLGVLPGIIGSLQAMEAIKWILGVGDTPTGRLLHYDALRSTFRSITLASNPRCELCGPSPSIHSVRSPETESAARCAIPREEIPTITVEELAVRFADEDSFQLIDVRQPEEHAECSIEGSELIPLGVLPDRLSEVSKGIPVIVHCKSGGRSSKAVQFLLDQGFDQAINLAGGIDAWRRR